MPQPAVLEEFGDVGGHVRISVRFSMRRVAVVAEILRESSVLGHIIAFKGTPHHRVDGHAQPLRKRPGQAPPILL